MINPALHHRSQYDELGGCTGPESQWITDDPCALQLGESRQQELASVHHHKRCSSGA